jgi:hypothetical protein
MNLNGFLDGLSKEKYLVYFLLAWQEYFSFGEYQAFTGEQSTLVTHMTR